jgi:hypothetical protein
MPWYGKKYSVFELIYVEVYSLRYPPVQRGFTPLHHAGARGHLELIHLLLDFGWRVDITNDV